jgi:hypothetical protein
MVTSDDRLQAEGGARHIKNAGRAALLTVENSERCGTAKARAMQAVRRMIAAAAAIFTAVAPCAGLGGQVVSGFDPSYAAPYLPPPADTGKPATTLPPALFAPDPDACVPALPCGSRLIGEVRKNGAVVLQVPALRW